MKVSITRRIQIAEAIIEDEGTDCRLCGGYQECCSCPFKRNCGDVDSNF